MTEQSKGLTIERQPDESDDGAMARSMISPEVLSAISIADLSGMSLPGTDLRSLINELEKQVSLIEGGDRTQSLLTAQAHTLDAIFNATIRRGMLNIGNNPNTVEMYFKLALKAQAQCVSTLESLNQTGACSVSINQANIANGPQQVNNFSENELLGVEHGERLDKGTQTETVRTDQELEAVGAVNRTEDD